MLALALVGGFLLYRYFFYTCGDCGPRNNSTPNDAILSNPDLLYAKREWAGLCSNKQGEGGSCYFNTYLYRYGKLTTTSGWTGIDGEKKIINPATEKELDDISLGRIIKQIQNSGILNKSCEAELAMDYSADYFINLDGIKKEIKFPGCESELKEIDNFIDAAE